MLGKERQVVAQICCGLHNKVVQSDPCLYSGLPKQCLAVFGVQRVKELTGVCSAED